MPKKESIQLSRNLQEIIKEVSENPTYYINDNMKKIEEKQSNSLKYYLKAMIQRLQVQA